MAEASKQKAQETQTAREANGTNGLIRKITRPLGGSAIFYLKEGISTGSHFMPPEFEPEEEALADKNGIKTHNLKQGEPAEV